MRHIILLLLAMATLSGCRSQRETISRTTSTDSVRMAEFITASRSMGGHRLTSDDVELRVDVLAPPDSLGVQAITATKVVHIKAKRAEQTASVVLDTVRVAKEVEHRQSVTSEVVQQRKPPDDGMSTTEAALIFAAMTMLILGIIYKINENHRRKKRTDMG